jgi:hypothetical protein
VLVLCTLFVLSRSDLQLAVPVIDKEQGTKHKAQKLEVKAKIKQLTL